VNNRPHGRWPSLSIGRAFSPFVLCAIAVCPLAAHLSLFAQVTDLTGPAGLPLVYKTFQEKLRGCAKGAGHEEHDLKRLIALFRAWHARLYPEVCFEAFVEKLEGLGAKRPLQACLRTLRAQEVHGERFDDRAPSDGEQQPGLFADAAARANAAAGSEPARAKTAEELEEEALVRMALEEDDDMEDEYLEIV